MKEIKISVESFQILTVCTHSEDDEYNIQYQVFSNETLNMSSLQSTLINDCI